MAVTVMYSSQGSSSLTIRSLYDKVGRLRPDIATKDAAQLGVYLNDAVRRICRETGLAREVQLPVVLPGGADRFTLSASTGNDILRVVRVRIAATGTNGAYLGTWDANANVPALTSTPSALGSFYIVTTAGATTLNGITPWAVGDVVLSNGTAWTQIPLNAYHTIPTGNKPTYEQVYDVPQMAKSLGGAAFRWAQEGQFLYLYPRPAYDMAVELTLSVVPNTDVTNIPLPNEALDCIVALARYEAMMHPFDKDPSNENSDMAMRHADRFKKEFMALLSELRGVAETGYTGSAVYDPGTQEAGWP